MADDGVGPTLDESPIGGGKSEGAPEGPQRYDDDHEANELNSETSADAPMRVRTGGTEEDATERPAKRQHPITKAPTHCSCASSRQIRDHNPGLLRDERGADQRMRAAVVLDTGQREQCSARSADQVQRDSEHEHCWGREETRFERTAQFIEALTRPAH